MYNKILNIILSWIFPVTKKTKKGKLLKVIREYFLFVIEIPYDKYRIEFCDENAIQIDVIYNSWKDAFNSVNEVHKLKEDMSSMFPYTFYVSCVVSEQS